MKLPKISFDFVNLWTMLKGITFISADVLYDVTVFKKQKVDIQYTIRFTLINFSFFINIKTK